MPKTIVGLGEVLTDQFPEYEKPGGAPANVVYNLAQLGNEALLVSAVGQDQTGRMLRSFLTQNGLDTRFVQESGKPSGTVKVTFSGSEASYAITEDVAWDDIRWNPGLQELAARTDAVCFSTLSQRAATSAATIERFLQSVPSGCLRVLDVNLRPPFFSRALIESSFQLADVVKVNEHEYAEIEALLGRGDLRGLLLHEFGLKLLIITLGKNGSRCVTADTDAHYPTQPIDTSSGDSVGVGDAFIACVIHHLLKGTPMDETMRRANRYAGLVAAQQGAMVPIEETHLNELR